MVKLPYGSLFHESDASSHCVFIAGGTGITPFLSLFTGNSFITYQRPKLYAGFRNKSYNLYDAYLLRAKEINSGFEYNLKFEDLEGMLDIAEISSREHPASLYFLSGPPAMIASFRKYMETAGIDKANIRTDDWE